MPNLSSPSLITSATIDGEPVPLVSFDIRSEPVRIETASSQMDPMWVHRDHAGHWHYIEYDFSGKKAMLYRTPTMDWLCDLHGKTCVNDGTETDECEFHWECKNCTEILHPKSYVPMPTVIPGPTSFHLVVTRHEWVVRYGMVNVGETHILTMGSGSLPVHIVNYDTEFVRLEG